MDEKIKNILYNLDEENIAKLGEMLADADNESMQAELARLEAQQMITAPIDQSIFADMAKTVSPKDISKLMEGIQAERQKQLQIAEKNNLVVKAKFRQIGIVFDTAKLIVQNRTTN